jgi:ATP-binding protein involved in chromosome partitioning
MQKTTEQQKIEKERIEQDKRLKERMSRIKYKIIVISGKGGVGKTTVAINLAYGLAGKGNRVGILDVDIHGPNIAKMLGIEGEKLSGSEAGIEPVPVMFGLKAVSLALLLEDKDQPVIWRGPLKMMTIKQFLADVNWGELDYLIVDSPPGTGDEPLSVCQLIPDLDGAIIVTTPQDVAILDSRKSVLFAKELKIPIVGIIENMSGFLCPHCQKEIDLFGTGGGEKSAQDLKVPFLGRIPLEPEMVKSGDSGRPYLSVSKISPAALIMNAIAKKVTEFLRRNEP